MHKTHSSHLQVAQPDNKVGALPGNKFSSSPLREMKSLPHRSSDDGELVEDSRGLFSPRSSRPLPSLQMPTSFSRGALVTSFGGKVGKSSGGWENYSVRLVATGFLSSSAGGVTAFAFLCDPTSLPLSEWSTFASLFDEVKIKTFLVRLATVQSTAMVAQSSPLHVGSFTRTTATPSSALSVDVAPDSVLMTSTQTSQLAYTHKMKVPRDLLFAATSSPAPGPYAGCPGSIQVFGNGMPSTASTHEYVVVGRYHLRGRL